MKLRGFTLIELLTVISIISLLASIVFSSLVTARMKARIGAGQHADASINNGVGLNLVAEWRFNEASGVTLKDSSGFNNDATIVGTVPRVAGLEGSALSFDGSTVNYAIVASPTASLVIGQPALTITAWVNPAATVTTDEQVVGSNSPYLLWLTGTNQVKTGLHQGGAWYFTTSGTNTIRPGEWQFIAVVYDGTTRKIYINGAQQGGTDVSVSGSIDASVNAIGIGQDVCCAVRPFNGLIDEVRIYSSGLTAENIGKLYAAGAIEHPLVVK